jgi:hypothetical protein
MSTSHHLIVESLTTSNLQKHTTNAHETPRTKIHRYFNQAEDPRILSHREHTPTQHPASDAWDPTKDFLRSTRLDTKLTAVGDYQSPILGYKERPQSVNKMDNIVPTVLYRAFQFEENDILVHNINKHNIPQGNAVPVDIGAKRNREDDASVYSWSDSQQIDGFCESSCIDGRERLCQATTSKDEVRSSYWRSCYKPQASQTDKEENCPTEYI